MFGEQETGSEHGRMYKTPESREIYFRNGSFLLRFMNRLALGRFQNHLQWTLKKNFYLSDTTIRGLSCHYVFHAVRSRKRNVNVNFRSYRFPDKSIPFSNVCVHVFKSSSIHVFIEFIESVAIAFFDLNVKQQSDHRLKLLYSLLTGYRVTRDQYRLDASLVLCCCFCLLLSGSLDSPSQQFLTEVSSELGPEIKQLIKLGRDFCSPTKNSVFPQEAFKNLLFTDANRRLN